jgi:hypothetical protein
VSQVCWAIVILIWFWLVWGCRWSQIGVHFASADTEAARLTRLLLGSLDGSCLLLILLSDALLSSLNKGVCNILSFASWSPSFRGQCVCLRFYRALVGSLILPSGAA